MPALTGFRKALQGGYIHDVHTPVAQRQDLGIHQRPGSLARVWRVMPSIMAKASCDTCTWARACEAMVASPWASTQQAPRRTGAHVAQHGVLHHAEDGAQSLRLQPGNGGGKGWRSISVSNPSRSMTSNCTSLTTVHRRDCPGPSSKVDSLNQLPSLDQGQDALAPVGCQTGYLYQAFDDAVERALGVTLSVQHRTAWQAHRLRPLQHGPLFGHRWVAKPGLACSAGRNCVLEGGIEGGW